MQFGQATSGCASLGALPIPGSTGPGGGAGGNSAGGAPEYAPQVAQRHVDDLSGRRTMIEPHSWQVGSFEEQAMKKDTSLMERPAAGCPG